MNTRLRLCGDLESRNVIFDHRFIFERSLDYRALITRYRGTVCRDTSTGCVVTAWQKSLYRFGNFPLEEAICATILLDRNGIARGVSLDEKSHGGLGPLCDFHTLQGCMNRILRGKSFAAFSRVCPTAGDARCLHLFEVLGSAAGFYEELLRKGETEGSEEELMRICPKPHTIRVENEHILNGKYRRTDITLRHVAAPTFTKNQMPAGLISRLEVRTSGEGSLSEPVEASDFRGVYGKLNRAISKVHRMEKEAFNCAGRMRFTNYTSLTGLLLLTMSHSAMRILRGPRILMMLQILQTGGERMNCIGFSKLSDFKLNCCSGKVVENT